MALILTQVNNSWGGCMGRLITGGLICKGTVQGICIAGSMTWVIGKTIVVMNLVSFDTNIY